MALSIGDSSTQLVNEESKPFSLLLKTDYNYWRKPSYYSNPSFTQTISSVGKLTGLGNPYQ